MLFRGTTADPGLVAYWHFPPFCTEAVQWLITYVMLSRPRGFAGLRSVSISEKIREIIERGPPTDIVATFEEVFGERILATKRRAEQEATRYGLTPQALAEEFEHQA